MSNNKNMDWWQLHVSALLQDFCKLNFSTSMRFKALSLMSVINARAGGFGRCSEMSSSDLARAIGVAASGIYKTLATLESLEVIRKEVAPGKGNRLVITPLSPDHWKLSDGRRFKYDRSTENHEFGPESEGGKIKENYFDLHDKSIVESVQFNWRPIFKKIITYVESESNLSATDPSKLLGVMVVVLEHVEGLGKPCSLNQKEIGQVINQNNASVGKILKILEDDVGVITRVWGQGKKIITPVNPDTR